MSCGVPRMVSVYRDLVGWDDDGTNIHEQWDIAPDITLHEVVKLVTCFNGVQATMLQVSYPNHILWSQNVGFKIPQDATLHNVMRFIRGNAGAQPSEQNGNYVFMARFPPPSLEVNA